MSKFETTPTLNSGTGYGLLHAHFVGDFQVYIKQSQFSHSCFLSSVLFAISTLKLFTLKDVA